MFKDEELSKIDLNNLFQGFAKLQKYLKDENFKLGDVNKVGVLLPWLTETAVLEQRKIA